MPLRIFTNISSLNSQRSLARNNALLGVSISRVASGIRIQNAKDDAAGLAVTEQLSADTRTLAQGARNLNDGISLVNTAEGAMGEQSKILIRMRELASQAATGTVGKVARETVNLEFQALRAELDRISATTEFAGTKLLDGSLGATSTDPLILQVGTTTNSVDRINLNQELDLVAVTSANLGISGNSIATETEALTALDALTGAIDQLVEVRSRVGAGQQRLTVALNNLTVSIENLNAAVSQIRDADLAEELANLTRNQILVQSGAAMISQANLIPQAVLTLLS
ncbi:MAG: flagellin [Nitrospinaceae bacterium]